MSYIRELKRYSDCKQFSKILDKNLDFEDNMSKIIDKIEQEYTVLLEEVLYLDEENDKLSEQIGELLEDLYD